MAHLVVGDISTEAGALRLITEAHRGGSGRVDILVNNAGIAPPESVGLPGMRPSRLGPCHPDQPQERVRLLRGPRSADDRQRRRFHREHRVDRGNTWTCSGASYAAAKAGMLGYTHQDSATASRNVAVNCVSPGFMRTPMSTGERHGLDPAAQEAQLQQMGSNVPMRRMGGVEDIAAAVAYLQRQRE